MSSCMHLPSYSFFSEYEALLDGYCFVIKFEDRLIYYFSTNPWCNHRMLMLFSVGCYPTVVHCRVAYSQPNVCSINLRTFGSIPPLAWNCVHYYLACTYFLYLYVVSAVSFMYWRVRTIVADVFIYFVISLLVMKLMLIALLKNVGRRNTTLVETFLKCVNGHYIIRFLGVIL